MAGGLYCTEPLSTRSMTLTIPPDMQQRITKRLQTLPLVNGKVTLCITFNCTNDKVGTLKLASSTEEEYRP